MKLTPQGSKIIEDLAGRYQVSTDAVMSLLHAVINGGGTMAQFSHPELGGSGQWMRGGMTMVGDMFNNALKATVDGLCTELSGYIYSESFFVPSPPPPSPTHGDVSLFVAGGSQHWWPADLGVPSSTGAQNNIRYAVFPATHRLAIDVNGQLTIYDTLDHQIGGVGQQQGPDASLTFTSQLGLVRTSELPVVSGRPAAPVPSAPAPEVPSHAAPSPAPAPATRKEDEGDIFAKIERLAELRQKGILSEEEFASKKAELLARL
ncbi:MAG: SHOCT domain-containing protein [Methylotetracoccus sp.]